MPYLLNIVYLLLILVCLPWLVIQAVRKGKYREGYAAKFFGLVPRRTSDALRLAARRQRRRSQSAGPAAAHDRTAAARLGVRRLDDHHDRHGAGEEEIRRPGRLLLPAGFHLGGPRGDAADSPRRAGAGRVGTLAEPGLGRPARRRPRGRDQRPAERAELSPAIGGFVPWRRRCCGRSTCWPCRTTPTPSGSAPWALVPESIHVTGSMKYDGAQTDRDNPATQRLAALAGFGRRRHCLSGRQHAGAGRGGRPGRLPAIAARVAEVAAGPGARAIRSGSRRWPGCWTPRASPGSGARDLEPRLGRIANAPPPRVLLVDAVGELGAWWGTAQIAFVGGSLGNRGGQNMIEPAAYGAAVSFRPQHAEFPRHRRRDARPPGRRGRGRRRAEFDAASSAAASRTPPMPPPWGSGPALVKSQLARTRRGIVERTVRYRPTSPFEEIELPAVENRMAES